MVIPPPFAGAPFQAGMGFWGIYSVAGHLKTPLELLKIMGKECSFLKVYGRTFLLNPLSMLWNSAVGTVTNAFKGAWKSINTFFGGGWKNLTGAVGTVTVLLEGFGVF